MLGALAAQVARSDAAAQRAAGAAAAAAAASSGGAGGDGRAAAAAAACAGGADMFSCLGLADGLLLRGGAAPIEAVMGDLHAGLAISLGAALPWLCVHLGDVGPEGVLEGFLEAHAGAAAALGWRELAAALSALGGMAGAAEEPHQWLPPLCTVRASAEGEGGAGQAAQHSVCASSALHCRFTALLRPCPGVHLPPQALCGALFPTHSRLVLQRLLEAVQRGAERYQAAAIACMRAIFQARGGWGGSWSGSDAAPPCWHRLCARPWHAASQHPPDQLPAAAMLSTLACTMCHRMTGRVEADAPTHPPTHPPSLPLTPRRCLAWTWAPPPGPPATRASASSSARTWAAR